MGRKPKCYDETAVAIRQGMALAGIRSVAELARVCGIPQTTLSRKMKDGGSFSVEDLYRIGKFIPVKVSVEVKAGG